MFSVVGTFSRNAGTSSLSDLWSKGSVTSLSTNPSRSARFAIMSGPVDPATGMIANLADLDGFVEREVTEPFDHKSLNEDVPAFRENVPTTENICKEIYQRLKHFPMAKLERVRVEETGNNTFEYAGEEL